MSTPDTELHSRRIVNATGGFSAPHLPRLPGLDTFSGSVLHSAAYRSPQRFAGQHVVVVGAGNSAVQIASELAALARVTLTSRQPVKFLPQRPLGRDIHDWLAWTHIGHGKASRILRGGSVAVLDDGRHRAALKAGNPLWRPMFSRLDGDQVHWADGGAESVDVVIMATGFRPRLSHLAGLTGADGRSALNASGAPLHRGGASQTVAGLGFVGLEWQRGFASATLRGVGPDAAHLITRLS